MYVWDGMGWLSVYDTPLPLCIKVDADFESMSEHCAICYS